MASNPTSARSSKPPFWRWHLLVLCGVLLLFFARSFSSGLVLFANDAPLGLVASQAQWPLDNFTGYWQHLYWFGGEQPGAQPNITQTIFALIGPAVFGPGAGPVHFSKFYAPLCLMILGLCAGCFFRSLGFSRTSAFLGGLAAMLSTDAFSNACWGLPSWALTWAMVFLALAALVTPRIPALWMRVMLAGFAVGMALMEGYDVAAIFSLYVGVFCIWNFAFREGQPTPERVFKGGLAGAAVAICAAWMAMVTLTTLVGTQIKGVTQQETKSPEEKWAFTTSGSLPKKEALRVIVPGLFGYRMDTPGGGQYWGAVNRSSQIDDLLAKVYGGNPAEKAQIVQTLNQQQGNTGPPFRHSGSGEYAGVLVVLLAIWAVCQSLRGNASPYSLRERRMIWFWTTAAGVSLLLAFGRYAPFYQIVYKLPYFSAIRNPIKFMQPFHVGMLILFAHGLEDLCRRCLVRTPASNSIIAQVKHWWATVGGFDRKWAIGMSAAFGASVLGLFIFASSRSDLVAYLQLTGFTPEDAPSIASFATRELIWFLLFFALSALMVVVLLSGALGGNRAKWAGIALGILLVADMSRANSPWILYENYKLKYKSNGVIDLLRDHAYEHRVAMGPNPGFKPLENFHGTVYHKLWLQHHFPFYNVQSLDIPQEPRVAQEKVDYANAFATNPARYWQLSNTRYLFGVTQMQTQQGPINYVDLLNAQLDPVQKRFRVKMPFTVSQEGSVISATTNTTGPFALIEFTGALPRARLYANWQVQPELSATLTNLAAPQFDPLQTVLVTAAAAVPAAGVTNAGSVEILSYAPKHIELKAEAQAACVLLLNDRYHPGWKVWVDEKPAELLRANYIARGVMLQPGSHKVVFKFQPPIRPLLVSLSAIFTGLVLCGLVCFQGGNGMASAPADHADKKPSAPEEASPNSSDKLPAGKRCKHK